MIKNRRGSILLRGVLVYSLLVPSLGVSQATSDETCSVRVAIQSDPALAPLVEAIDSKSPTVAELLESRRIQATQARVDRAVSAVRAYDEQVLLELSRVQTELAAIQSCPLDSGKEFRNATCVYLHVKRAMLTLKRFVVPVVIGYTSEIVGLDAAGVQAMAQVREGIKRRQLEIRSEAANPLLSLEQRRNLALEKIQLSISQYTVPYLTGLLHQMGEALAATVNRSEPATPEQKKIAGAERKEALRKMGLDISDAVTSVTFREMRGNIYVLQDYLYRFFLVTLANVSVNSFKALFGAGALGQAPWQLIPNAGTMMAYQSEVAARKTQVQSDTLPSKDAAELLARIPGIIAGKTGFLHESFSRTLSFLAGIPMELLVLTLWTGLYFSLLGQIDPLSLSGWVVAATKAFEFIGLFGLYLILKWAVWDKPVDLGFIPEFRGLARKEYDEKMVALAEANSIPVETVQAWDPIQRQNVSMKRVAWHGKMWKQYAECFQPASGAGKASLSQLVRAYFSGEWKPKLESFKNDYARFQAFQQLPQVQELNASPVGRRVSRQKWAEFLYRTANTAWDTFVAIWMAGGAPAKPK